MIVEPKVREFICTTAHAKGCKQNVLNQINYVRSQKIIDGPKKVLIIGASTGYGLASRITAAYSCNAATLGVMFERPSVKNRTATPGWYNTAAFEEFATKDGLYATSINGDAFSLEVKQNVIDKIKKDLGKVDLVIYSLAAPKRLAPDGNLYSSVLKTTGEPFTNKSLNLRDNTVVESTIDTATDEEIAATVKVMGGEDWKSWIEALSNADVLSDGASTIAYSYLGSELTYPVYLNGTIGKAKEHLYNTSLEITKDLVNKNIKAYVSVNKAVVTQASAAIPIVPLYIAILYRLQKEKGTQETCIEQISRLFHDKFCTSEPILDSNGMFRMDDYELAPDLQKEIVKVWNEVNTDNVLELADIKGYWLDFYQMFGFSIPNVDYTEDIEIQVPILSI